jgi:hypothetical protein
MIKGARPLEVRQSCFDLVLDSEASMGRSISSLSAYPGFGLCSSQADQEALAKHLDQVFHLCKSAEG